MDLLRSLTDVRFNFIFKHYMSCRISSILPSDEGKEIMKIIFTIKCVQFSNKNIIFTSKQGRRKTKFFELQSLKPLCKNVCSVIHQNISLTLKLTIQIMNN